MVVHFENVSDTGGMSAYGDLTLRLALPPSMGRTPSDQGGVSATGLSFMCITRVRGWACAHHTLSNTAAARCWERAQMYSTYVLEGRELTSGGGRNTMHELPSHFLTQ